MEIDAGVPSPRTITGSSGGSGGAGGIIAGCLAAMIAVGCGGDSGMTETLSDGGPQTMMKDGHMSETTTTNDGGTAPAADTGAPADVLPAADTQPAQKIDVMDVIRRLTAVPAGVPFYFYFPATNVSPQGRNLYGAALENAPMPNAMKCSVAARSLFSWDVNMLEKKWWSSYNSSVDIVVVRPLLRSEMDKALMQPITEPNATTPEGKPVKNIPVKGIDEWIEENKANLDSAIEAVNSSPGQSFQCR
jgi:hypothetical protein